MNSQAVRRTEGKVSFSGDRAGGPRMWIFKERVVTGVGRSRLNAPSRARQLLQSPLGIYSQEIF
jgi:hypothetical protein